jgi:hypothetical protein
LIALPGDPTPRRGRSAAAFDHHLLLLWAYRLMMGGDGFNLSDPCGDFECHHALVGAFNVLYKGQRGVLPMNALHTRPFADSAHVSADILPIDCGFTPHHSSIAGTPDDGTNESGNKAGA